MKDRATFPLGLVLLAAMLGIAVGIEAVRFGDVAWIPKLPLGVLLGLGFLRR